MDVLGGFVDFQVVAFCLLFGNVLKNFDRLCNNFIPLVLMFWGVGVSLCLRGLVLESVLVGVVSAWVATGVHSTQSGVRKVYRGESKQSKGI